MENRRTRMTKTLLKKSLLDLLEQTPFEEISITDICRAADVNRSTFYAHYGNTSQLMEDLEEELLEQFPSPPQSAEELFEDAFLAGLERFFRYVYENSRPFRVLLVQRNDGAFKKLIVRYIDAIRATAGGGDDSSEEWFSYVWCLSGVIGTLREWIYKKFPCSPEAFARITLDLAVRTAMPGRR